MHLAFLASIFLSTAAHAYHIALCVVATGKYDIFARNMITSARRHFLPDHQKTFFVFTNGDVDLAPDTVIIPQKRLGWPHDSLMRNQMYLNHIALFEHCDYVYALDADMLFVDTVGDEILGSLVAVQHPGFVGKRGTYERRKKSTACVHPDEGVVYFAGGFFGGSRTEFYKLISTTTQNILKDLRRRFIAVWHDESHLNRYLIDHPPSIILPPSYCYPESWTPKYPRKLLALDKNHKEVRK